jgi:nitrile hydratase
MNGIHDLGGMHGFGPVEPEVDEPVFHADWERIVLATQLATLAQRLYNLDEFRHGIERMAPAHYLEASYYERWLASIETLLVEKGILNRDEIVARLATVQASPEQAAARRDDPALVARVLGPRPRRVASADPAPSPRFAAGDAVRARNVHPTGHTRLPRYVRGKRGEIARVLGSQTFPDTNAHGLGKQPQAVYSVRFTGQELWGDSAEPNQVLFIDLWESYLDPA